MLNRSYHGASTGAGNKLWQSLHLPGKTACFDDIPVEETNDRDSGCNFSRCLHYGMHAHPVASDYSAYGSVAAATVFPIPGFHLPGAPPAGEKWANDHPAGI